ncbi:MAG: hypothetical protein AAFY50_15255 [Cyanobacteria bacterium J06648_1]
MLKIILIIISSTICTVNQINPAIAKSKNDIVLTPENKLLLNSQVYAQNQTVPREGVVRDREQIRRQENLTKILIFGGLVSIMATISWQMSRRDSSGKTISRLGKVSNKALIDRVSPKLRRQLLRLINDPKTANRLLMGIHQHHRDRDPDWLAEKVIYDLRRGR